ncbi:hypothetical protein CQ047_03795 [Microbacterium sp. MYb72]|nr:hypothetical protein CQ047_03795 [Microbacterium sp. MYb72]
MRMRRYAASVALGTLFVVAGAGPAMAESPEEVDPLVVQMLEDVPGGVLVDATHAEWPELGMALTVPTAGDLSARTASGSCASGLICVYKLPSLSGAFLSYSGCGVLAVPGDWTVRSMDNNRASGYAQARNVTTVLATANAGSWTNVGGTTTNIRCVF